LTLIHAGLPTDGSGCLDGKIRYKKIIEVQACKTNVLIRVEIYFLFEPENMILNTSIVNEMSTTILRSQQCFSVLY
jgi:hypothetical protein